MGSGRTAPRYLLITDDPGLVDAGVAIALRYGFVVAAAPREPGAIAAAMGKSPDVVLLDLVGREGDAASLLEAARGGRRAPAIVVIAGIQAPRAIREDPALLAMAHAPCSPDEIRELIECSCRADCTGRLPGAA